MARNNQRGGPRHVGPPRTWAAGSRRSPARSAGTSTEWVDYKDVPMLRKYMSDRGKIRSRRVTGNCAQHQRALAQAIKTARELVLLPYTQRTVTERPGGRGGGRDRGERGERGERAERTLSDTIGADAPRDRDASVEILSDVGRLRPQRCERQCRRRRCRMAPADAGARLRRTRPRAVPRSAPATARVATSEGAPA